jgi:hypothetical protein
MVIINFKILEETGPGLIEVLSWHSNERTKGNQKEQRGQPVSRLRFEINRTPEYKSTQSGLCNIWRSREIRFVNPEN